MIGAGAGWICTHQCSIAMIDDLARDLHALTKADFLIGRIWLDAMTRRFGFFALAGLTALFGLGMLNVAAFYVLRQIANPGLAAAIVAAADFILAAIVTLVARTSVPGSQLDLAFDVRKMAINAVQADALDLKHNVEALSQEFRDAKDQIAGFVQDPLGAVVQRYLVPALVSIGTAIAGALGSKKPEAGEKPEAGA